MRWVYLIILLTGSFLSPFGQNHVSILSTENDNPRINFGVGKLSQQLKTCGYTVSHLRDFKQGTPANPVIIIGISEGKNQGKEGFTISSKNNTIQIEGADYSGALYGCLELADRIRIAKKIPQNISFTDKPEMVLRGSCIGLQKSTYLPGRGVYEYPYTPETFPWFYDKQLWIKYLDSMVENRMNSLYLWNGHPFASLVKLKDYPFAVEVDDETFKKNEEIFKFLTTEADKRGIWVIQMFYNIIVSKPFAEHYKIKTQDRERHIIPYISDYTRKSIAAFVEKYPNVGLMVALGEAMEGVGQDDIDWFTKTIIPGVKDGLKALGKTEEPPIVLRAHDTDAPAVMAAALPLYKNLYTEAKYNGEALTTYTPRGPWAELHRTLSRIGTVQIENVHILANLEPFRYGSADFIQRAVQAMHAVHEGNGLHLYPESSYWDWPYTADKTSPRLLQIDRDWVWYKAWARYAWNCRRDQKEEINYWSNILGNKFGADVKAGKNIFTAYKESGEIAPKLLRRFGITDGNRQTLTLGMFMTQLINPFRYGLFTLLYNSEGPEGEMLTEYAEKEWKKEKHIGETPVKIIAEVKSHGKLAVKAVEDAAPFIRNNKAEFERIRNDMHIYDALANHYAEKADAALLVLRYKYSNDIHDLQKAAYHLETSVHYFRRLVELTENTYLYANSMQTQQRKIPIGGDNGTNKTWAELLPLYEHELKNFKHNIDSIRLPIRSTVSKKQMIYQNAFVTITSQPNQYYSVGTGSSPYSDTATYIKDYAGELKGLNGIKFSKSAQIAEGTVVKFTNAKPIKVLVGYFNSKDRRFLQPPELETNASANDYGQAEIHTANALLISGMPPVNIHTYTYPVGSNTITLGKGASLVLGFVNADEVMPAHDAGLVPGSVKRELDWLFESGAAISQNQSRSVGDKFKNYINYFNSIDTETVKNYITNDKAVDWLSDNIPLFECPDTTIEKIYYYRWWTFRKHLKKTPDGYVFTEFITQMNHGGKYNTISSALGHHIYEGRWLRDPVYIKEYINFWLHTDKQTAKPHLHNFSSWLENAVYNFNLVNPDRSFISQNLSSMDSDYVQWETERKLPNGKFWQYDVRDAMEESISGGRKVMNVRPTINSYMYGNAIALNKMATISGNPQLKIKYQLKADSLKSIVQNYLWDDAAKFFKVRLENGNFSDAREAIGFIPWYFNLPDDNNNYARQWDQLTDTTGFRAPWGLTTAERRHPTFRTHGSGHGCEWDGAVWPFATTQTLKGLSNLLTHYKHHGSMNASIFYDELRKYAESHTKNGLPYLGEYQDEKTGYWLKGDNPRSSYYNHSCFVDLVISDLIGIKPREDNVLEIFPLIPQGKWKWFLLDKVNYHGKTLTIIWDETGKKYNKGKGLMIFENNKKIYTGNSLKQIMVNL